MGTARVRRDRHGRGLRGPLAPPTSPLTVPRADAFADLVADAVDRLEPRWGRHVEAVDVEVLDAPPADGSDDVALAAHRVGPRGRSVTLVVYRRPVELRAAEHSARVDLVRDLVAEELAAALGLAPEDVDPTYDADE